MIIDTACENEWNLPKRSSWTHTSGCGGSIFREVPVFKLQSDLPACHHTEQTDPQKYNDESLWPDKVRLNRETAQSDYNQVSR